LHTIGDDLNSSTLIEEIEYTEDLLNTLFTINQGNAFYTKKRILTNGWVGDVPVYSSNTKTDGFLIKITETKIKENNK